MAGKPRVKSPDVVAMAEKAGVDLANVTASAEDGRVSKGDVLRASLLDKTGLPETATNDEILAGITTLMHVKKLREERAAEAAAAAAEARERTQQQAALRPVQRRGGRAYALNPLVDQVRAEASAGAARTPTSSAPTLFASGDLPVFTASGIDPSALLDVPWQARHAMAAAATAGEAYAIVSDCSGADAETSAQMLYGSHPGNADYAQRVQQWQVQGMSDEQLRFSTSTEARAEIHKREAALPLELPSEDQAVIDATAAGYGLGPR